MCIRDSLSSRHADEVKIGQTDNVRRRLAEVNRYYRERGIDLVFTYQYSVRTLDAEGDEKLAHAHFAAVRLPGRGELFRTTPESVRDFFDREIKPRYLLENGARDCEPVDMDVEEVDDADMDIDAGVDEDATDVPMAPPIVLAAPSVSPVAAAAPAGMPTATPLSSFNENLKAFVLEHLMYSEGSLMPSSEIREVFLRHTGVSPAYFPSSGPGSYKQLGMWLNGDLAKNKETLLISGVYLKNKHVQYLGKQSMAYVNLAWKDGPIAEVVREARLALGDAAREARLAVTQAAAQ